MNTTQATQNGGIAAARRTLKRITAQHRAVLWLEREHPGRPSNGATEVLMELGWGTTITDRERATEAIEEQARSGVLSVEWQGGWTAEDKITQEDATEWRALLAWGGPAVQVVAQVTGGAVIQGQDWFTPWETIKDTTKDEDAALWWFATVTTGVEW